MGINAWLAYNGLHTAAYPEETALGSLLNYISTAEEKHFQPMNINFGLMPLLQDSPRDKKRKYQMYADRALKAIDDFIAEIKSME
jgi:methylenetetrahydrofolate--tRNA-(uracil-5-)-methyltransferase